MIRASAPYTLGWGSFVLLKMDRVRVAWGGSLNMLHWYKNLCKMYPYAFFKSLSAMYKRSLWKLNPRLGLGTPPFNFNKCV